MCITASTVLASQAPPLSFAHFQREMDLSTLLDRYPTSSHELTPGRGVRPRTSQEDERAWIREFFRTHGSGQYLVRVSAAESHDHIYAVQADVRAGVTERLWLSFEQPLEMVRPADRARSNDVRHPPCAPILAALTTEYGRPAASPPRLEEALEWFDYEWTRASETMTLECGRYRGRTKTFASAVTMK